MFLKASKVWNIDKKIIHNKWSANWYRIC